MSGCEAVAVAVRGAAPLAIAARRVTSLPAVSPSSSVGLDRHDQQRTIPVRRVQPEQRTEVVPLLTESGASDDQLSGGDRKVRHEGRRATDAPRVSHGSRLDGSERLHAAK